MTEVRDPRRALPGVDRLLERPWCRDAIERHGRAWVTDRLRDALERVRSGGVAAPLGDRSVQEVCEAEIERASRPSLERVINATGVVLHTNLGRAPLARQARDAMARASGYGNLEFDLADGGRGSRYDHCARPLARLTGAEDAVVVNNCAGALALALAAVARGGDVVVSNGELVEIGGGFRIPEVVAAAGCRLRAVGTTNCTRVSDYAHAVERGACAVLKVHRSNFTVSGFAEATALEELVALGARAGVPVIHDLGSGLMLPARDLGLPPEPTPADSVAQGADLVAFSGDKLLGGPQAGILAGSRASVDLARAHPLCRALRSDKATLAGLEATLALYRSPRRALREIPTLRMIAAPVEVLERRAKSALAQVEALLGESGALEVVPGESLIGGGTFPGARLPSALVRARAGSATARLAAALRARSPPVVSRTAANAVLLDLRTVEPEEDGTVVRALADVLRAPAP